MWSGKMATRWRRKDGHLKAGKDHFLSCNNPDEFKLNAEVEMDSHSTVDHSILAIFEDSSTFSEDKADAEDNDKLLSALTEMLESVEDDDEALFPFKTLPETALLMSQDTTKESSLSETHDDQKMSLNEEHSNNREDAEVEVFTSASLVNLVKLMHSYCLKLQVEEEPGKSTKNSMVFSKEEVWKYERPTEENDEEINVVSDDEESMEVEMKTRDNTNKPLKSALLNGSPSKKEKKRVSFGAVQVASFDMDSQTKACSAANHNPTAIVNDTPEATISSENDQTTDISPQKSEGKRKPISLQQYRQLRQKRQPLLEKQGNYTTKWPSVSVPPKELTPILGVHGQKQTSLKPAAAHNSIDATNTLSNIHAMKTKASSDLPHKAKRPRLNGKIQLVADCSNLLLQVHKKSPSKMVNSDPPNPVLVPLPLQHPPPENTQQFTEETSITEYNLAPKSNNQNPIMTEQQKCSPNISLDLTKQSSVTSESSPSLPYEPPTPVTTPVKEVIPETAFSLPQPSVGPPVSSGIEASDLTSLLEQFEETQAKEGERAPQINSQHLSKLDCAAPNSILRTIPVSSPDPALLVSCTEELLSTSIPTPLDFGLNLKIPEPLVTEVILSSRQDNTVRRKVPPAKAIQIIEPRPLPCKRAHAGLLESSFTPAHVFLAISSDHDYCTVVDSNKTSNSEISESVQVAQANTVAAVSCPKQTSEADTNSLKNATQDEQTRLPVISPPLITDSAKKQNSNIRLDAYMIPPTPPPSPPCKGGDRTSPPHRGRDRERRMYHRRSHSSDSSSNSSSCSSSASSSSSSRSRSRSPKRQRRSRHSSSSPSRSTSPSPTRHHQEKYFSRSRSTSWSQSRSRSRSLSPPQRVGRRRWTDVSRESRKLRREQEVRVQKLRAIDERRVVYVGRIRRSMTHEELRERFSQFGDVESVSLHFRDRGDHYGFVTFYNMDDAFTAIDNGGKVRRPDELPFDICFGGRRQFCNSDYADLDANRDADRSPVQSRFQEVDFDLLLKQAQKGLKR